MLIYSPVFTNTSNDVAKRWQRIREFVEAWYIIKIPVSFRSYITLSKQLLSTDVIHPNKQRINAHSKLFRDDFEIVSLENHQAISLMMRGEADFYYGVKTDELKLEDPTIHGYLLDYKSSIKDKFDYYGRLYPSITSFTLSYLLSHLQKDGSSGFYVTAAKNQDTINSLRACFTSHSTVDNLEIFESNNILAFLETNPFEQDSEQYILRVYLWKELDKERIPDELLEYAKRAFFVYGMFSEEQNSRKK